MFLGFQPILFFTFNLGNPIFSGGIFFAIEPVIVDSEQGSFAVTSHDYNPNLYVSF